ADFLLFICRKPWGFLALLDTHGRFAPWWGSLQIRGDFISCRGMGETAEKSFWNKVLTLDSKRVLFASSQRSTLRGKR
ncbi:hypothetical protein RLD33_00070, partial [Streptococcus pneumoniae]|nr:hypothetical protein [Streptococcus pneumoniae]